jgi:predicted transcriptional regulator
MADLLRLVQEPQLKTHIMYKVNLSFEQSQNYFEFMVSTGLIHNTHNKWIITEKGRRSLQLYDEAEKVLVQ